MNEIRIGLVSAVSYKTGSVDVIFPDEEDTVYQDCSMLSGEYQMPKVNDLVAVVFQTNSAGADQGFVIGVPYSSENLPEKYGKNVYFNKLSEKAYIHYDPDTETLHLHAPHVVIDEKGEN